MMNGNWGIRGVQAVCPFSFPSQYGLALTVFWQMYPDMGSIPGPCCELLSSCPMALLILRFADSWELSSIRVRKPGSVHIQCGNL